MIIVLCHPQIRVHYWEFPALTLSELQRRKTRYSEKIIQMFLHPVKNCAGNLDCEDKSQNGGVSEVQVSVWHFHRTVTLNEQQEALTNDRSTWGAQVLSTNTTDKICRMCRLPIKCNWDEPSVLEKAHTYKHERFCNRYYSFE